MAADQRRVLTRGQRIVIALTFVTMVVLIGSGIELLFDRPVEPGKWLGSGLFGSLAFLWLFPKGQ